MKNSPSVHTSTTLQTHCISMPERALPTRLALAFTVLHLSLQSVSCRNKEDPLPGGYFIFVASDSEIFLNEPTYGGSIPQLGTDLEQVGNHHEFIFGRSGADRGAAPGYFLLNTKSGAIKTGLAENDWLAELTSAGVPAPPILVDPRSKSPRRQ